MFVAQQTILPRDVRNDEKMAIYVIFERGITLLQQRQDRKANRAKFSWSAAKSSFTPARPHEDGWLRHKKHFPGTNPIAN